MPYLVPLTVAGRPGPWPRGRPGPTEPAEPAEPERSLHLSQTLDDRYVLDGSFDAEGGAVVATALRLATTDDPTTTRTPATQAGRRPGRRVPVLPRPPAVPGRRPAPAPPQRGGRPRRAGGGRGRPGRRRAGPRRRQRVEAAVRLRPAPGADGGPLGHPRLRHVHPHHPRPPVERPGHPRRALPLPGLRPALDLVRGPPRALGHPRRADRAGQPRAGLHPPPPPAPPTRTGRPSSCPTPPSRSPTPTASSAARHHRERDPGW